MMASHLFCEEDTIVSDATLGEVARSAELYLGDEAILTLVKSDVHNWSVFNVALTKALFEQIKNLEGEKAILLQKNVALARKLTAREKSEGCARSALKEERDAKRTREFLGYDFDGCYHYFFAAGTSLYYDPETARACIFASRDGGSADASGICSRSVWRCHRGRRRILSSNAGV